MGPGILVHVEYHMGVAAIDHVALRLIGFRARFEYFFFTN